MKEVRVEDKESLPGWDLSALYLSEKDPKIELELKNLLEEAEIFEKYFSGKVKELSGEKLAEVVVKFEKIEENLGKLATFAYLYFVTEMTNEKRSGFYQNVMEKINGISQYLLFLPLEICELSDEGIKGKLKDKGFAHFEPFVRDVRISRDYQRSKEVEKILHEKDQTACNAWSRLFDETMAGLEFDFDGEMLGASEIFDLMSSKDAEKRKKAAKAVGQVLQKNIKLFSFITNTLAKDKAIDDGIRNYPHVLKSRNISNLIEDDVVDNLVSTVKENYANLAHRYYKLKAEIFGVKELDYWDRNAPLPDSAEGKISWEEAKEIVLEAYEKFSPKMAKIVQKFFDLNWIDVPPRKGKDSGAFSHPATPATHPYIMLNFQGKLRDVMTLAHELGHGVHQYLSREKGYLMSDTPLTLAETASIFGEQLTFESLLLKCKNDNEKKNLLAAKIEDSLNTIVRQVAFHDFEVRVHEARKESELSAEKLGEIWLETQSKSLGDSIKLHDEYKCFWSYIPHFIHSPFYVYAYAFGNCLVNSLYQGFKDGIDDFEGKYLEALSAGGTLHHSDLLKPFGLNAHEKDFWKKGLELPIGYIDEFEKLIKS